MNKAKEEPAYLERNAKVWGQHYEVFLTLPECFRSKLLWALVQYGMEGILPDFKAKEDAEKDAIAKAMPEEAQILLLESLWKQMRYTAEKSRNISIERAKSGSKGGKASKRNNPNGRRGKRDAEPPGTADTDTPTATADALPPTADTSTAEPLNLPKGKVRKRDADVIAGRYESFLTSLFANANREAHTATAQRLGISYEKFKAEAVAIVDEWRTTGQMHTGYNDAARHVISLIRCRTEAEERKHREELDRICREAW